jgi:hypothetical protein
LKHRPSRLKPEGALQLQTTKVEPLSWTEGDLIVSVCADQDLHWVGMLVVPWFTRAKHGLGLGACIGSAGPLGISL